jgi:excisionase family DNA binding protein
VSSDDKLLRATAVAIGRAKREGRTEVTRDDLLVGLLATIGRFGVVTLGDRVIDLDELGVNWLEPVPSRSTAPKYSAEAAKIFDKGAAVARAERVPVSATHLLVAYDDVDDGLMGALKQRHGVDAAGWRAAMARYTASQGEVARAAEIARASGAARPELIRKDLLSPEESAELLGVHTQTIRGYIRSGKLPALRVAGERAIRIRREDLLALLEPLVPEDGATEPAI